MAEFVEECRGVVPGNKDRLAGLAFNKIGIVGNDGGDVGVHLFLCTVFIHPCTGTLAGTCIRIEIPQADMLSGSFVLDFPNANIRMIDRKIRNRRERKIEQLTGNPEHTFAKFFKLQIRLHFIRIQIVLCFANLFRIVTVIPRLDLDTGFFLVGQCLHVSDLFVNTGDGGFPHRHHQFHRAFRGLCHFVRQPPMGVCWKPEQFRPFGPKLENLAYDPVVVVFVAIVTSVYK